MSVKQRLTSIETIKLFYQKKHKSLPKDRPFKLVRYFSLTSLTAFAIAFYSLNKFYQEHAIEDAIRTGENSSIVVGQLIGQNFLSHHRDLLLSTSKMDTSSPEASPALQAIYLDVQKRTVGSAIEKVTIFNTNSLDSFEERK
jgi:hypothetical protein